MSLQDFNGDKIEGDEVETEMFKFSPFKLNPLNINQIFGTDGRIQFTKLRVFQFSAVKKKMSGVIRRDYQG